MRIVDKKTFLKMPKGTVFSKVSRHSCDFGDLNILSRVGGGDFWFTEVSDQWDPLTDALDAGDGNANHKLADGIPLSIPVNLVDDIRDGEVIAA